MTNSARVGHFGLNTSVRSDYTPAQIADNRQFLVAIVIFELNTMTSVVAIDSFGRRVTTSVVAIGFHHLQACNSCLSLTGYINNVCPFTQISNVPEMLRFLSRRKSKSEKGLTKNPTQTSQQVKQNKNLIVCKIIVLDGSDLTIELHVSFILCLILNDFFI